MIEVQVELGDRSYPVLVGARARDRLMEYIPPSAKQVAVVTQQNLDFAIDTGTPVKTFYIGDGEVAKTMSTVEALCREFARMNLNRKDCIVAVGGGLVTDLAGFAAAIYHRGIPVIHIATTLLAQVDAAIGGKTGVNLPEGKNLAGAFWQPLAVLCDTETLQTLSPREYLSGTGEVAKYHFLGSRAGMPDVDLRDLPLDERVAYCAELKARIVAADEREGRLRMILNYGHTLAHAIEIGTSFDLRHGECVAIGLNFAAELAKSMGRISAERVAEHRKVLDFYGLPHALPPETDLDALMPLMHRDKKAMGSLTFILDGPDGVEVVDDVDPKLVRAVLEVVKS
jgi:5-deoxy-5-amino-3-dehydroquinate synthase